jgi:uncharacterized protein
MKHRDLVHFTLLAIAMVVFCGCAYAQEDTTGLEKFFGFFEITPGNLLYVQPNWELGGQLMIVDDGGQTRALHRESQDVFVAGPSFLVFTPTAARLTFLHDTAGEVSGMNFGRIGFPKKTARKVNLYAEENVRYQNGLIQLSGKLLLPPTAGRHPAIVLIHGSGPGDRYAALFVSMLLRGKGIAVLGYDKRGVGESTGDWHLASLQDLADDAIAGVRFLKSRPDIDPDKIGVFGGSQGGWIAPLAALRSSDIKFVISICGPGVPPSEQELDRVGNQLAVRGFPKGDVEQALALMRQRDNFVRGTITWDDLQAAQVKTKDAKWMQFVPLPRNSVSSLVEELRHLPMDYNPTPILEKLRVPTLALFGELDLNVVPTKNSEIWNAALQEAGNKDFTIRILKRARHGLLEVNSGSDEEVPRVRRVVPECKIALVEWLCAHGLGSCQPPIKQSAHPVLE